MELSIIKEPNLVVAIDVGSTYSGYAWQWRRDFINNRSDVCFNTNWGVGALQLHKTSTCLLMEKDVYKGLKVDSFGHLAEKRFCIYCDDVDGDLTKICSKYLFFKWFKLLLYSPKFNDEMEAEDYNGQCISFMEVMSCFIGALKDHFLKYLENRCQPANLDETLWVVTVPAIWTDKAKKFMRDAAEKVGIDKKHLLIALEPESAALYCMNLPSDERKEMNNFGVKGDKFIVADLGGGTLDALAIEVLDDGNVREICAGTGDRIGGQDVNNAFFQSCKDVIDGVAWNQLGAKNVEDFFTFENDFESKKIQIGSEDVRDEHINVNLPGSVKDMIREGKITINYGLVEGHFFKLGRGKLMYDSKLIRDILFMETVQLVLATITKILRQKEVKEVRTLVLVGGFAESNIVVGKIRDMLSKKFPGIKVVVPTSPFRAVLKGAVLFGHDPLIFQSRISRATLGIAINELFDPKKHDIFKMWRHDEDGKDYCKDIFHIHMQKDKLMKLKEKQPSWTYNPTYKRQTVMGLDIYSSQNVAPKYTTDYDCKQIGKIIVDLQDTTGGRNRKVKVEMIYGGTELSVRATDESTKKEYPAAIRFDTV